MVPTRHFSLPPYQAKAWSGGFLYSLYKYTLLIVQNSTIFHPLRFKVNFTKLFMDTYEECPTAAELEELDQTLEKERQSSWAKLKKTLDTFDFYDLVIWWYELEIKNAWYRFCISNTKHRLYLENRCKFYCTYYLDGTRNGGRLKLSLLSLYSSHHASKKDFIRLMCALRGNATLNGVILAIKTGDIAFNTFETTLLKNVREELCWRFDSRPSASAL